MQPFNLAGMADLPDVVARTTGEVVRRRDGTGFYYARQDDNRRPSSVLRHRLGTAASDDACVLARRTAAAPCLWALTRSGGFAVLSVTDRDSSWR